MTDSKPRRSDRTSNMVSPRAAGAGIPSSTSEVHLPNPFGELGVELSPAELRETAYEILVGASRSSGGSRPLTYVSKSARTMERSRSMSTPSAASKLKKALGLKKSRKLMKEEDSDSATADSVGQVRRKGSTTGELIRVQMRVSEQTDSRVRRGLLRVAASQLGKRIESMVLPLELLQYYRYSDFPSQQEYDAWQMRIMKILEAGLLLHPHLPLDKAEPEPRHLRKIIHGAKEKPIEPGKDSEPLLDLRKVVMSLACRSFNWSQSDICHWADGVPLNLRLYQILLEACFDVSDGTSVIEEVDELVELIKKTWVILGLNEMFHNLCFLWVLFQQYVVTGQTENDLLSAAEKMLLEVEKDAKETKDTVYTKILGSVLNLILRWAEKQLLAYHDAFYRGNIDVMQSVLSLGLSAARILVEDICNDYQIKTKGVHVECDKVSTYIRSSLRNAFSQEKEKIILSRRSTKHQQNPLHILSVLAQSIDDLAFNEKEIYSPVLRRWHPLSTAIAVATLHACYANEFEQFVSSISELTPEAVQVLIAADKLEKDLVQMAVTDSVESEDGGKEIIQEINPYEAEAVIANLVKSWIRTRVDRVKEWVDRNLQQEVWSTQAKRGQFAPSVVEVLRIIDETLEAFFLLPIPVHPEVLPELMNGLDKCLQIYIVKVTSGCGSKITYLPTLPALTRCSTGSKFSAFRKRDKSYMSHGTGRKSQVVTSPENDSFGVSRLCVRVNTLYHIRKELEVLENRVISNLRNIGFVHEDIVHNGHKKFFELSEAACVEGVQQLSESTAYKIVFHDLNHVLWDYLYIGEASLSRIEPFLQELEQNLVIISTTVHDRVRTRVITNTMKASFDGFLLVLLAGGPSRAFSRQDAAIINEDFSSLRDLFWSNGDGLPADLIDKFSVTIKGILPLFSVDTENLIEQFKHMTLNLYGASGKSSLPLPPTSGEWKATEPNTILRVLCNRNDKIATRFLKRTYNLPKKL